MPEDRTPWIGEDGKAARQQVPGIYAREIKAVRPAAVGSQHARDDIAVHFTDKDGRYAVLLVPLGIAHDLHAKIGKCLKRDHS